MKKRLLLFAFSCFAAVLLAQTPGQTLRGTVTDADTGEPLVGASVLLLKTNPPFGTNTTISGTYVFEKIPVGRHQLQVSYLGYEALTVAEVLVESGRETVLNVQLRERADSLKTIVVKAPGNSPANSIGSQSLTIEEQFRFPGTNFDPARLAMAYPGVAGNNDGTNVVSVRGNSPNALQWRLEGVEIVNPNHTANAGTFGDRATGAGGGVNILSAQLLGTSSLHMGAFPAQYGNALGGVMDMYLRPGNDQHHELIAQAGFIGIEAAVEGPISVGSGQQAVGSRAQPSFLANYRYSFTGLLTGMGVDFGDEETAFQDLAFHVSLPSKNGGKFTLFGLGGKSSTLYKSPTDTATIDKERFNIDFRSQMGALGMTHVLPVGKSGVLRTVAVGSALEHDRTADLLATGERWEDDNLRQQKLSFSSIFSQKINVSHRWRLGVEAAFSDDSFHALYENSTVNFENGGDATGWIVQPFMEWHASFGKKTTVVAGMHASVFTILKNEVLPEPRISINYDLGKSRLSLAYGLHSQNLPTQLNALTYNSEQPSASRAHHLAAGYQLNLAESVVLKAETYYQSLFKVPVYYGGPHPVSTLNFIDFSQSYFTSGQPFYPDEFESNGEGRNYGLDLSLQKYLTDRYFFLLAGSVYRSQYAGADGEWRSTRFDGGHTLNLTAGREVAKQKHGKTIINGISGRVAWLGGFRDTPIDVTASAEAGYTVYEQQAAFSQKLDDYFRVDLRLYRKWNRTKRNSMLSLDIQNAINRENAQYYYFDTVQGKVLLKKQLGLIPILTWRGEF